MDNVVAQADALRSAGHAEGSCGVLPYDATVATVSDVTPRRDDALPGMCYKGRHVLHRPSAAVVPSRFFIA